MNLKEFLRPTLRKLSLFLILLVAWIFLPLVPIKAQVMCNIPPCYPAIEPVSLYRIIFKGVLYNNYIFTTPATFIVPVIEFIILYLLALAANRLIESRKSKVKY